MDISPEDSVSPPYWRPSMSVFAYEPSQDEAPRLCGQRLVYIRVTVSITGLQPPLSGDEEFDVDPEFFESVFSDYLACYGALLNVSVYPMEDGLSIGRYPRIIDFEPKKRELIQAASIEGELLTQSGSQIGVDRSFSQTSGSEFSMSQNGKYSSPKITSGGSDDARQYGEWETSHAVGGKFTNTNNESSQVNFDASTERRERYSHTTSLSQLFNLLNGYHIGTNRATFMMLPRPHQVQPTRVRTFVQGVRQIEGVQDFFLVVTRPADMDALRVSAVLETGHVSDPEPMSGSEADMPDTIDVPYVVPVAGTQPTPVQGSWQRPTFTATVSVPPGWEFDDSAGEPGRGGVELVDRYFSEGMHGSDLESVDYRIEIGRIVGQAHIHRGPSSDADHMTLLFRVYIRRAGRAPEASGEDPLITDFIGARTKLLASFGIEPRGCIRPLGGGGSIQFPGEVPLYVPPYAESLNDEAFLRQISRTATATFRMLLASQSRRTRRLMPSYVYTSAFGKKLARTFFSPKSLYNRLSQDSVLHDRFPKLADITIGQFMTMDVHTLAERAGVDPADIVENRLGMISRRKNPA